MCTAFEQDLTQTQHRCITAIYNRETMDQLYTLRLNYPEQQYDNHIYKDSITHAASIELFVRGIHCSQSSANTLVFNNERDVTYAGLLLCADSAYTVEQL